MFKAIGAAVMASVVLAVPVMAAEGVILQAPYDGPVPPVSRSADGRASGDGWVFYRANGCISYYDAGLKQYLVFLHTMEGRVFGADTTMGTGFYAACATDANIAFYMTPGNNSWTQFAVFPASTRAR